MLGKGYLSAVEAAEEEEGSNLLALDVVKEISASGHIQTMAMLAEIGRAHV